VVLIVLLVLVVLGTGGGVAYWALSPACENDSDCGSGRSCVWAPKVRNWHKSMGVKGEAPPTICAKDCVGTPKSPSGDPTCAANEQCIPQWWADVGRSYCQQGDARYKQRLEKLEHEKCFLLDPQMKRLCEESIHRENRPSDEECVKWSGVCLVNDAPQRMGFDVKKMGSATREGAAGQVLGGVTRASTGTWTSVQLTSVPSGASISYNGKVVGRTPAKVRIPPDRPISYVLHLNGHPEQRIELRPGDTEAREVKLDAGQGSTDTPRSANSSSADPEYTAALRTSRLQKVFDAGLDGKACELFAKECETPIAVCQALSEIIQSGKISAANRRTIWGVLTSRGFAKKRVTTVKQLRPEGREHRAGERGVYLVRVGGKEALLSTETATANGFSRTAWLRKVGSKEVNTTRSRGVSMDVFDENDFGIPILLDQSHGSETSLMARNNFKIVFGITDEHPGCYRQGSRVDCTTGRTMAEVSVDKLTSTAPSAPAAPSDRSTASAGAGDSAKDAADKAALKRCTKSDGTVDDDCMDRYLKKADPCAYRDLCIADCMGKYDPTDSRADECMRRCKAAAVGCTK
jgi:hypothetical protein